MGVNGNDGKTDMVEFKTDDDCYMVHHLMTEHDMTFQQAIDYLELRPDFHFTVVTK